MDIRREENMWRAYYFVDILMKLGLANAMDRSVIYIEVGNECPVRKKLW